MASVAKRSSVPRSRAPGRAKILRLGVIQAGRVVEERLIRGQQTVTIGTSTRNTIAVPAWSLPRSVPLFERVRGEYHLLLSRTMDGRVSLDEQIVSLEQARQSGLAAPKGRSLFRLRLNDRSRGKVQLGEVTLLFQFVAPPPLQPHPQLPPSVQGSVVGQLDGPLAWSFGGVSVAVTALVLFLHGVDLPRRSAPDVVPEAFDYIPLSQSPRVEYLDAPALATSLGERKLEKATARKPDRARQARPSQRKRSSTKPCDENCRRARDAARRARLIDVVSRTGILQAIGNRGRGPGFVPDLLGDGDPGRYADEAFSDLGGLTTASEGSRALALRGKGGSSEARPVGIPELSARVRGPEAVQTGGRVVERSPRALVRRAGPIEREATLEANEVGRVVRRGLRAVKRCYERALKGEPGLSGKVAIRLTISATGRVTAVEVETDTMGDARVSACIAAVARRWRFAPPEGGGPAEVTVPFVFRPAP